MPRVAEAHALFAAYVQHGVNVKLDAQHLDVTVNLTFFEEWSAKERQAMDKDGNGRISRSEVDLYVKELAPRISKQLKLRVGGREISLALLYDPEIDLLGEDKVGPGHHRLHLLFFALSSVGLHQGDVITVEDSLWPKAKALGTVQVECGDGGAFESKQVGDFDSISERPNEPIRFTLRCLQPPKFTSKKK